MIRPARRANPRRSCTTFCAERQAAWRRLFSHYLHSAHGAAVLLRPDRAPITVPAPLPGVTGSAPSDEQQARDWFAAENLTVMDIIDRSDDADAWRLAWTLADYFHWNGRSEDWASRLADTSDAAGRAAEAIEARRRALEILTRLDHPPKHSAPGSRPGTKTTLLDAGTVAPR